MSSTTHTKKQILKTVLFLVLFSNLNALQSQPKDLIKLPQGGELITFKNATPLLSIYVTAYQEVYIENVKINFFEEIPLLIRKSRDLADSEHLSLFRVLLYADQNTDYKFIDRLKSYIAKSSPRIFCQTDDINDIQYSIPLWLSGTLHKLKINEIPVVTNNNENPKESAPFFLPPPPPPPTPVWYHQAEMDMYSGDKNKVLPVLKTYTFKSVYLENSNTLRVDNELILLSDKNRLKDLILNHDILFLRFVYGLSYNDYIQVLKQIRESVTSIEKETKKRAWIIEVSFELEEFFIQNQIKF